MTIPTNCAPSEVLLNCHTSVMQLKSSPAVVLNLYCRSHHFSYHNTFPEHVYIIPKVGQSVILRYSINTERNIRSNFTVKLRKICHVSQFHKTESRIPGYETLFHCIRSIQTVSGTSIPCLRVPKGWICQACFVQYENRNTKKHSNRNGDQEKARHCLSTLRIHWCSYNSVARQCEIKCDNHSLSTHITFQHDSAVACYARDAFLMTSHKETNLPITINVNQRGCVLGAHKFTTTVAYLCF